MTGKEKTKTDECDRIRLKKDQNETGTSKRYEEE